MNSADHMAEIRARKALQESGLPHSGPLTRASSTRNEVFLAPDHVVRFNRQPNRRLSREATLCAELPQRSWAPVVTAYGGRPGADYLIVTRRQGTSLSRCWPQMSTLVRKVAICQFTEHLADLHRIRVSGRVPPVDSPPHLLGGPSAVGPLLEGIRRLSGVDGVDHGLIEEARAIIADFAGSLDNYSEARLIHGDLSLENVLWDGSDIVAIVDFEWCRGGPADLDLDILARYFSIPGAHVSAEAERWQHAEDYDEVPGWMAEVYPDLFSHPRLGERLMLYALAFEVRDVLASPPPAHRRDLGELHPYHRLVHLVATGGHVTDMMSHLGLVSF